MNKFFSKMAPFITVFVEKDNTHKSSAVIRVLEKYYPVFIDADACTPMDIKSKYAGSNAKFFGIDIDEWIYYDLETVDAIKPCFVITFDKGSRVKKVDWRNIYKWVRAVFSGNEDKDLNEIMFTLVPRPVLCPEQKMSKSKKMIEGNMEGPKDYEFRCELFMKDIMLVEVIKPHTDRPYTVVIREFEQRGYLPFFTALFVCTSWGVCSLDIAFLEKVWTHLNMKEQHGALDIEKRLKENIERCKPSDGHIPDAEPEVYRLDIMSVKEQFSGKRKVVEE